MQTRRRRGHRPLVLGIDGLIAAVVVIVRRPLDIGRQRQAAVLFQQFVNRLPAVEAQAEQFARTFNHHSADAAFENQHRSGFRRLRRTDMCQRGMAVQNALYQRLDFAAAFFLPEQPRLHYFGIVKHQNVARADIVRQIGKRRVLQRYIGQRGQQAAAAAHSRRVLRNQRLRQIEIEIGNIHSLHSSEKIPPLYAYSIFPTRFFRFENPTVRSRLPPPAPPVRTKRPFLHFFTKNGIF